MIAGKQGDIKRKEDMKMLVLAKTITGKEFVYSVSSARKVSKASANTIYKIANDNKYLLKDGECWHVYDVDQYDNAYYTNRAFRIRNGIVSDCTYN